LLVESVPCLLAFHLGGPLVVLPVRS
jgi:hypothetical protein